MGWFFLIVGALLVFAIAAAFVGSETFRLGHETPSAIFDMDEALQEVGDAVPDEVQARLTYDELRRLILATLDHLESKGLAAAPGRDVRVIGERDEVVVADEDTVAMALRAVDNEGLEVSDEDAYEVIKGLSRLPRRASAPSGAGLRPSGCLRVLLRLAAAQRPRPETATAGSIAWFTGATREGRWSTR